MTMYNVQCTILAVLVAFSIIAFEGPCVGPLVTYIEMYVPHINISFCLLRTEVTLFLCKMRRARKIVNLTS